MNADRLLQSASFPRNGLRPTACGRTGCGSRAASGRAVVASRRGICPYAGALIDAALAGIDAAGLGADDRLRSDALRGRAARAARQLPGLSAERAFHLADGRGRSNSTSTNSRRLGRFLAAAGRQVPPDADLARVMLAYDARVRRCSAAAATCSARQVAEAMAELRRPMAAVGTRKQCRDVVHALRQRSA